MRTNAKPQSFPSFTPAKTLSEITREWSDKQKKKADGSNNFVQDFLTVAALLCSSYKTFNFRDVTALTRALDTPVAELVPLFDSWTADLFNNGRATCLNLFGEPEWTFK